VAVGRLDPLGVAELVGSVAAGCREAGCTLIGGETAEHPGLMPEDAFDLAGSCIGVVEREALIDGSSVEAGDAVIGLRSSGLHANGFSLVRALIAEWDLDLGRPYQEQLRRSLGDRERDAVVQTEPEHAFATLGEVLLTPTRIYARGMLAARDRLRADGHDLRGVAHITGGGLPGNVPRSLPDGLGVRLDPERCPMPPVMRLLGALGGIEDDELRATFNGGIGMTAVVAPPAVPSTLAAFTAQGFEPLLIGEVVPADGLGGRYAEGPLERIR
jgi:phosphoribosylformylglycinamidine cyclo-ligase